MTLCIAGICAAPAPAGGDQRTDGRRQTTRDAWQATDLSRVARDDGRHAVVLVEYFYTPGCEECRELEEDVFPSLTELLGEYLDLKRYDIYNPTNYLRLAVLQEKSGVQTTERVAVYVDETVHLGGLQAIKAKLIPTVEAAVLAKTEGGKEKQTSNAQRPTPNVEYLTSEGGTTGDTVLNKRMETWTIPVIALAGLIDGLNPCAFATLIFFMTLLSVAGKRGRELIAVGIGFCGAVFITYFLLGFGVFHIIQGLSAYALAGEALRWLTVSVLVILCLLSFKDAWAFGSTGQAGLVRLQLPKTIRNRIHSIMHKQLSARRACNVVALRAGWLLCGSCAIGFLVTLLESVCTGQVYVPTLVYLSRQATTQQALGLLVIYNAFMVTPQVLVFLAGYYGVTNARLLQWSRANVVTSKILLGLLFAALAGILAWL
ncbi:MAG: hypothetical protein HYV36_04765 [Lentisphaerae bacterium]|nr:hypothetical protein [Lentisphaerota bacterium]